MFTELRNAINAAESVWNSLEWAYDSNKENIERYQSLCDSGEDWKEELKQAKAQKEAYDAVKAALEKFVKSKM